MKKLKLLLLCLPFSLLAISQPGQIQQIKIVSFTVKNQLPGIIDSWTSTPAALILIAQKVPGPVPMREPRMVVQIKSGGSVICGNNAMTGKQVDPFDVRTFNTADLTGVLTNCHELKEGTYTICVQFFNIDKVAISQEVCKDFRVEATNIEYAPPTLITPDNGKKFSALELQGAVMFRWTPLVPKPKEPVTYRLKVWQLMEGQNGTTAMRSNQPIISKDVDNLTQATVNAIYTGPCKPPYLCDFIWNVQALNRSGKPMGNNNGMSEPYTFGVTEEKTKCPANVFPEDKKKFTAEEAKREMVFKWTPNGPAPGSGHYRIKVWQLMEGQNGNTAMRTNQPVVTKDVDNLTQVSVSGLYNGPCKPPYLCDFIWTVEVTGAPGQTGCTSEPTAFSITEEAGKCPANVFPEDKKKFTAEEAKREMVFKWTPNGPAPGSGHYRIKVWQLMEGQNGNTAMRTNQPIVTKDVDNLTQVSVSGLYNGPCKPPYLCDFIWTVEVMNAAGQTGCTSEPTTFSITEENVKCPANLFPEDKKNINSEQAKQGITFKWTKIETPGTSSAYRLKVWQLMQGQNGTQAMKTNKPIVTKEVMNLTEATVSGIYNGPCKPPYLCDFIWAVEKINASGQTQCSSEPTMFVVSQYIIQIDSIKVLCTDKPGVYSFKYCITNPNPGTAKLNIFTITSSVPVGASLGSFSPPLNTTINSSGQLCITGTINAATNLSNICIGAGIQDVVNNFWQAQKDTCVKVEPCRCDACDDKNFVMTVPKPAQINWANNSLTFTQPITITTTPPKTVKNITAELVYFELIPQNADCLPCDKDATLYGHFSTGTNSQQWTGPQTNLNISITTPNAPCCSTLFRWCIRYKVEFKDCTVCSKLICYEKKKEGCLTTGGGNDNHNDNPK